MGPMALRRRRFPHGLQARDDTRLDRLGQHHEAVVTGLELTLEHVDLAGARQRPALGVLEARLEGAAETEQVEAVASGLLDLDREHRARAAIERRANTPV